MLSFYLLIAGSGKRLPLRKWRSSELQSAPQCWASGQLSVRSHCEMLYLEFCMITTAGMLWLPALSHFELRCQGCLVFGRNPKFKSSKVDAG